MNLTHFSDLRNFHTSSTSSFPFSSSSSLSPVLPLHFQPLLVGEGGCSNTPPKPKRWYNFLKSNPLPACVTEQISNFIPKGRNIWQKSSIVERVLKNLSNLKVGIDYLMGTIGLTRQQFASLSKYVSSTFDCKLVSQNFHTSHGCYNYTHRCYSPINGVKLLYLKGYGANYRASIIIPGKALRTLHFHDILAFMTRLRHVFRVKFTRIDLCMDDYRRRVSYDFLHSLAIQGETAGAQLYDGRRSGVCGDKGRSGSDSIYFGSKRRLLNIYNAEFMHGIPADRWEARFREDYCLNVCNHLIDNFNGDANPYTEESDNNLHELLNHCAHTVLNIVKFIHRKGKAKGQSVKTYKRYAFYDSFFKELDKIDPRALRNPPTPELNSYQFVVRSFDWLNKQVFKRLLTLKKAFGSDLFNLILSACLDNASERFTEADHVRLEDTTKFMKKVKSDYLQQFLGQLV